MKYERTIKIIITLAASFMFAMLIVYPQLEVNKEDASEFAIVSSSHYLAISHETEVESKSCDFFLLYNDETSTTVLSQVSPNTNDKCKNGVNHVLNSRLSAGNWKVIGDSSPRVSIRENYLTGKEVRSMKIKYSDGDFLLALLIMMLITFGLLTVIMEGLTILGNYYPIFHSIGLGTASPQVDSADEQSNVDKIYYV